MYQYFQVIEPMVQQFYAYTYNDTLPSPRIDFLALGHTTTEGCVDPATSQLVIGDENSYEYCATDNVVYVGQAEMWNLYNEDGDIAPAVGLAHEWGHRAQAFTNVPEPQTDPQSVIHEDQADCMSGAFLLYEKNQGNIEPADDVPSLEKYLNQIASSGNDPDRDHGDFNERADAINNGLTNGVFACNAYYSDTPIIS